MESKVVLRLEGLPFRVTPEEVCDFFSESCGEVSVDKLHLLLNREQRPSGLGFLQLPSDQEAKLAMQMDGKCIGDTKRYVKIRNSDVEEMEWQMRRQKLYTKMDGDVKFYCVRLYGIPYKVTEYDIVKWFRPHAECVDVQIHLNHEGRPSGDASAYFETEEQANGALAKDKQDMNGRYVNLFMDNVSVSFANASGSSKAIRLSGLPFRATEKDIMEFFLPETKCVSVRVILNREGRPSGSAIAEFESEEDVETAMKKNREHLGSRFVVLSREKQHADHQFPAAARESHGAGRNNGGDKFCVKMAGIPYRTTVQNILDWFRPDVDCVGAVILKNREDKPSGEAVASFASEAEARKALEKNRQYMGERFVILTSMGF